MAAATFTTGIMAPGALRTWWVAWSTRSTSAWLAWLTPLGWRGWGALVAGTAALAATSLGAVLFAKNWASLAVQLAVLVAVVRVLRFNLAAYLTMYFAYTGVGRAAGLWEHPGLRSVEIQVIAGLVLILAAASLWAIRESRRLAAEAPQPVSWQRVRAPVRQRACPLAAGPQAQRRAQPASRRQAAPLLA